MRKAGGHPGAWPAPRTQITLSWFAIAAGAGLAAAEIPEPQRYGAADRTQVTAFLHAHGSAMLVADVTGDGFVSDTDIAFAIRDMLVQRHGPELAVGDLDGDGVVSAEDVVVAIARQLAMSIGKADPWDHEPVGAADLTAVIELVAEGDMRGDVNLDGVADVGDAVDVMARLGSETSVWSIDDAARDLHGYIDAIFAHGDGYFMHEPVEGIVAGTHVRGVSSTWPDDRPRWWRDNHITSVSQSSFNPSSCNPPIPHAHAFSQQGHHPVFQHDLSQSAQQCDDHQRAVSSSWPANHAMLLSPTWSPQAHQQQISRTWPAGHAAAVSSTWNTPDHAHETLVSRGWWPGHSLHASQQQQFPPAHDETLSNGWLHGLAASAAVWPPNHLQGVSSTWGPAHNVNLSAGYPPSHVPYISTGWPGPQFIWPSSHLVDTSEDWGEPAPGPWPAFPADHT